MAVGNEISCFPAIKTPYIVIEGINPWDFVRPKVDTTNTQISPSINRLRKRQILKARVQWKRAVLKNHLARTESGKTRGVPINGIHIVRHACESASHAERSGPHAIIQKFSRETSII